MQVRRTVISGVLLFVPSPSRDERGFFSRTFDASLARRVGIRIEDFVQDSQSRSLRGVIRGFHGRLGAGEAKLVRCAHGTMYDVVVDARPDSPTFGRVATFSLDDDDLHQLFIPAGCLHGFQALTATADTCYRIDREHDAAENVAVRFDDPDLAVRWPLEVGPLSGRDTSAGSWAQLCARLGAPNPLGTAADVASGAQPERLPG